ncbi:bumetanide-sensitive sodium-(potassium)-chloride cotransporter-like [Daphnia pulicaria]|uniref:bumetanide-sensitive sodium-(potassium)-chloride cotransporter-like n=1 Tax=Daphnia pulicaria TaxID=35523 RepID=UPI001EEA4269|nr:bumetanide-sensitive sodium-(potassium)-chloride cotransporter-like [Daphnia pulicaria]
MSEDETNCDQSRCGIRIQVDPPSSLPPGNVHRPSNFASFTIIPTEAVHNNDHQGSAVQHEMLEIPNNRRKSNIVPPNLPTVPSGVEMGSDAFELSEESNDLKESGEQQETIEFSRQRRRSAILPPNLATVPSGVEMDNEAFVIAEEQHSVNGPPSRRMSLIDTNSQNSFRLGRGIQSSLRRLGMSMNLSRRGSTSTNTETVPRIANYRNFFNLRSHSRPTLDELHEPITRRPNLANPDANDIQEPVGDKFGWIEGVLIRNMLSIWGVMLFLRISWVVALSGIWQTLIIIAISTFITLMTALSMSAIATNGEIGGGGTYYVMSRVLGPEFGGSIGVIFAIANAINASLNVVGFCQSIQDLMRSYGGAVIVDGADNDIRIIGTITMIAVCALCGLGAKYEAKTQGVMLVILMVALANFAAGSIMGPGSSEKEKARGFLGYDLDLIRENWSPGYTVTDGQMQDFFSVFSVYFPAGIGILAGANVSGDLKDPNSAIPKGTILAICITSVSYAIVAIICGATMKRAATGSIDDLRNGTYLDCVSNNCTYGIYYDYQAMTLISGFGPLNYAGCFAATLSSALASYVSCPKLLKVIADDKLYPYWLVGILGKGYGKAKEPIRAYAFTFILALVFVLIAHLDVIALLISNFFLATFALMNYSTFHVSLVKPIGWRPTFKYYNMWLSLLTAALCVVGMFLISWPVALITIAIVLFFYLVVHYRNPEVNWGSSSQAQTYSEALSSIQQLVHVEEHVKNYRPQILALTGHPATRPALVDFAYLICKSNSLLICANVVKGHRSSDERSQTIKKAYEYLWKHRINGFCSLINDVNLQQGVSALLQVGGVGKMKPNILLLGYKNDWQVCENHSLDHYFAAIHTGFDLQVAVAILRTPEGLDCTSLFTDLEDRDYILNTLGSSLIRSSSTTSTTSMDSVPESPAAEHDDSRSPAERQDRRTRKRSSKFDQPVLTDRHGKELPTHIVSCITAFRRKQRRSCIDVWWLYDDGGLTLLLPHIINTRLNWSSCRLRVFCTASGQDDLENERKGMAALLAKFRITYSDLTVIKDVKQAPKESTRAWFDGLIRDFYGRDQLPVTEMNAQRAKTDRHLRLREMLMEHSSASSLVVMTLPMPRKGTVGAPLYMAWLEALSANMPPFLLIRGNQSSVLTFYS